MPMRRTLLSLGAVALLALGGCASLPGEGAGGLPRVWTQLGPEGEVSLRAIVAAHENCPSAEVDRSIRPMHWRARPGGGQGDAANPAFDPPFAVAACELALPPGAREVRVAGQAVALPVASPQRIVVLGDTGCRIKVPAKGNGDPIQDCTDPQAWPWADIAAAAAATRPDLVIHVGDYHYREVCDDPERCQPLRDKGVVVTYGWAGWNADFFKPAAPLLAAAPWVFVRGNHENCDRAGEGWMRFLSPLPYVACANQRFRSASRSVLGNNFTAEAYRIPLSPELALVVADNSGHEDYRPASATPEDVATFEQTLKVLQAAPVDQKIWLLSHKPVWYDLLGPAVQPNAFQTVLKKTVPANLQVSFAGHQHAFATYNFAPASDPQYPAGRPAQVIVGGGGTQLESLDPQSPFFEARGGAGSKERMHPDGRTYDGVAAQSGILLNRYSFLVLERDAEGWAGRVLDTQGGLISRCRLSGGGKEMACSFPGQPAN